MAHFKRVLSLAFLLCLATPLTAAAEEPTTRLTFVPPGHTSVTKWYVDELPGRVFERRIDAVVAAINANPMKKVLVYSATTVIPPAPAKDAQDAAPATVAAR